MVSIADMFTPTMPTSQTPMVIGTEILCLRSFLIKTQSTPSAGLGQELASKQPIAATERLVLNQHVRAAPLA